MERCKGLEDWFECLRCPHLCTKRCPIESDNVMEEMKKQMYLSSAYKNIRNTKVFEKLD